MIQRRVTTTEMPQTMMVLANMQMPVMTATVLAQTMQTATVLATNLKLQVAQMILHATTTVWLRMTMALALSRPSATIAKAIAWLIPMVMARATSLKYSDAPIQRQQIMIQAIRKKMDLASTLVVHNRMHAIMIMLRTPTMAHVNSHLAWVALIARHATMMRAALQTTALAHTPMTGMIAMAPA